MRAHAYDDDCSVYCSLIEAYKMTYLPFGVCMHYDVASDEIDAIDAIDFMVPDSR
jgi:hypothetical protein